jgi:type I restriction enzyme S subunit
VKAVHEIATIKTGPFGTLLKASEYSEGDGVPVVSVGEIREGFLMITDHTPRVSARVTRRLPQYVLKKGDIVFGRKGGVERSALIRQQQDGWFLGSDGMSVRPLGDCHDEYLALQFQSPRIQGWLLQNAIGTTMSSLNQGILEKVLVALPPTRGEQEAIAEALGDAYALVESLEQLIAKKGHLKQGAMQELLTGKKRLPGFSGEWEVRRLGEICEIAMGRTPSRLNPSFWGRGHKWLAIADLRTKIVSESKEEITERAASEMQIIPEGTLLMSFKLSIGRLCFAGCDLFTNEAICSFNKLKASADFIYYLLGRTDFSLYGKQAVKGHTLNKESLRLVEVRLPSREEQTAIAIILSDMDAEIAALEAKLAKARLLKQGMMQELLTGRLRLV